VVIAFTLVCSSLYANEIINNTANTSNDLLFAQAKDYFLYGTALENQSGSGGAKRVIKEGIGVAGNPRLKIINLGPSVNTSADDYAPTVTANGKTFYFVSNRQGSKLLPTGRISHDF
jgi:hypothetical protein